LFVSLSDLADAQGTPAPPSNRRANKTVRTNGQPFDRRLWIPYGDAGTAATIEEMGRQAVKGSRDPIVRLITYGVIKGIPGRDHRKIAERLFYWLQDHGSGEQSGVKFINDPFRTEQVRAPWWTLLVEGAGDCNSAFSTTIAAMLLSVGVPAFFRTVAADPGRPGSFSHVYTVGVCRGEQVALDASVSFSDPGSEPSEIIRTKDWKIQFFDEDDAKRGSIERLGSWLWRLIS